MNEILISALILFGTAFVVVGAVGLLRLPDVYNRLHATTKATTLGVVAIIGAAVWSLWLQTGQFSLKLVLTMLFLFLTAPVGAHMISRSAYMLGIKPWSKTVRDDLAGQMEQVREVE